MAEPLAAEAVFSALALAAKVKELVEHNPDLAVLFGQELADYEVALTLPVAVEPEPEIEPVPEPEPAPAPIVEPEPVAKSCPTCGTVSPDPNHLFCMTCGTRL